MFTKFVKSWEYLSRVQDAKILTCVTVMLNIFYPMFIKIRSINKADENDFLN